MKPIKHFLCLTSILICANIQAAELTESNKDNFTYASNLYKGLCIDIPEFREINGGTVINVTYDNCPFELQSAFNYACKIWEENLPTCLPINISVSVGEIQSSGNDKVLSKISMPTINFSSYDYDTQYASPRTMVKGVILKEYHLGNNFRFVNEIDNTDFFDRPDISIIYNEECIDEFSFNLESDPSVGLYDFVTLALRDIASGLGFRTNFIADTADEKLIFINERLTPFETLVMESINSNDPYTAYDNCTKGELPITIDNAYPNYGTIKLYAPNPWINNVSLNYFIPDSTKPITQLLSFDFCKGTVIRDITDPNYDNLFTDALGWLPMIYTGPASDVGTESGTTSDILPYNGSFSLPVNFLDSSTKEIEYVPNNKKVAYANNADYTNSDSYFNPKEYCAPYNYFYNGLTASPTGFTISVLKKDGTWDTVYMLGTHYDGRTLNFNDMPLHYDISEYARTCDGRLRYRFTNHSQGLDELYGRTYHIYNVKYYARNYTPQKAQMKFSKIHKQEPFIPPYTPIPMTTTANEDYLVDIEIGIKNLEGTTRVVVEQLDEGELLPYVYDVEDFKKGYFVATVDKEFSTSFTVISYNENGSTRSDAITIPPLAESETPMFDFRNLGNSIQVIPLNQSAEEHLSNRRLSYFFVALDNSYVTLWRALLNPNGIMNVPDLPRGYYAAILYEDGNYCCSYKFTR